MNISQLTKAIKYLPTRKSILLKGTHGIGKTELVRQICKEDLQESAEARG